MRTLVLVAAGLGAVNCSTKPGTGAVIGGIGAGLLTGSTRDAAMGAAVGAGIGYLSEQEETQKREAERKEKEALSRAQLTSDPSTAYRPTNTNPFTGTTWRVISLEGVTHLSEYGQIVVTFQTNTNVTTMYSKHDGESDAYVESYGVVDDVLVVSGEERGQKYTVTARFVRNGNLLSLTYDDLKVVLEEVREGS